MVWASLASGAHVKVFCRMIGFNDFAFGVMGAIPFLATFGQLFASVLMGRTDGTGLGLAIVKRILQSHHGDIELLATGPAGTTFRITLPLAP